MSGARPTEWYGLCDSDPVPGDPDQVAAAAKLYGDTASEIDKQCSTLKRLASSQEWQGDAAKTFTAKADDCADNLGKTYRRYEAAYSALHTWGPQLEQHQGDAESLRIQAQQLAPDIQAASTPVMRATPTTDAQKTQDAADDKQRATHLADLNGQLQQLRNQLTTVTDARDSDASRAASTIRDAIDHDGLKDSWWDGFKNFIGSIAGVLKTLATVLSWIATIVVFFCPVLGLALMGVVLLIHLTLAATGNGSWVDVGLDAIGLLTFGIGTKLMGAKAVVEGVEAAEGTEGAASGAKGAYEAFQEDAGTAVRSSTRDTLADQNADRIGELEAQRTDQSVNQQTRGWGTRRLNALNSSMDSQAATAGEKATTTLGAKAGLGRTLLAGDSEVAAMNKALAAAKSMPGTASIAKNFASSTFAARSLISGSYGLDVARHLTETVGQTTGHQIVPEYHHEIGSQVQESGWEWTP